MSAPDGVQVAAERRQHQRHLQQDGQPRDVESVLKHVSRLLEIRYTEHRFSSRRNWDSPNPSPIGECATSNPVLGGGAHSLASEGLGESQFRRGDIHCGTLWVSDIGSKLSPVTGEDIELREIIC
jgi:hypothetical protein